MSANTKVAYRFSVPGEEDDIRLRRIGWTRRKAHTPLVHLQDEADHRTLCGHDIPDASDVYTIGDISGDRCPVCLRSIARMRERYTEIDRAGRSFESVGLNLWLDNAPEEFDFDLARYPSTEELTEFGRTRKIPSDAYRQYRLPEEVVRTRYHRWTQDEIDNAWAYFYRTHARFPTTADHGWSSGLLPSYRTLFRVAGGICPQEQRMADTDYVLDPVLDGPA